MEIQGKIERRRMKLMMVISGIQGQWVIEILLNDFESLKSMTHENE